MGVLPIYMGVKGEENAGLTVSFLYFAMNKNASEKDQKATKQFGSARKVAHFGSWPSMER